MRDKKGWKRLMAAAMSAVLLLPASAAYAEEGQKAERTEAALEELVVYEESRAADADEFEINEYGTLTNYTGRAADVVIPDSVKSIGSRAFAYCDSLKSVTIPKSVTSIGDSVFYECRNLENVKIEGRVISIDDGAFFSCITLKSINLPEGLVSIGELAFMSCRSLESLTIPESVTEIEFGAFEDCSKLTIYGKTGSYAETYAKENNIPFVSNGIVIVTKDLSSCQITVSQTSYTYDGTAKTPDVTVRDGNVTLAKGTDYDIAYENNTNAGTAKVILTGKSKYTGTVEQKFTILKASQTLSYTKTYNKVYGDKAFTLNAKLTTGIGQLSYSSSAKKVAVVDENGKVTIKGTGVATITVKVSGTANYNAASAKITVKVSPKKPKAPSVKGAKGQKLTVSWKKDANATGYQVQYSTDKKFKKSVKSKTITKVKTVKWTTPKLKKGKKYYVRVRSYKSTNGQKVYSEWSANKSVVVKK